MSHLRQHLLAGQAIPAQPLALDANRKLSEKHQRALTRYYVAAGCGGLAVAVHSTQFEIRDHGLLAPVLEMASTTITEALEKTPRPFIRIAGLCGKTEQALSEAQTALRYGYEAGLLSLGAWKGEPETEILEHVRTVAKTIPVIGFYLQPSVGGRIFTHDFWRRFAEIENILAIKIAPFNRYQTIDVVRAVAASGREDIALYTGNDDTIVTDLLTPFRFDGVTRRIVGGLLGHWGVWSRSAVELLEAAKALGDGPIPREWLTRAIEVTDMNAALFDPAHQFAGCIPGILEVLRRQGLVPSIACLNPHEVLSPGQAEELTRVCEAYPHLTDDAFVAEHLDDWLR
ncbi:MAG TPA: dihydrodipicolinate synthase family protein [Chthoniobacteraceae bacterium]|nr:dihydrodipicolinate synthase family protein [Chthoniobacteraceae bacterium]